MSDRNLIARLLNLDVLVRDEARRLDLEDELSIHFVRLALLARALNDGVKLFGVNQLVNLVAAAVAGVDSHLHAGLDVASSRHNTTHLDELADVLGLHTSHLHDVLPAELAWNEHGLVIALEFSGNALNRISVRASSLSRNESLLLLDLTGNLQVVSTLVLDHVESGHVLSTEVEARLWYERVDDLVQDLDVSVRVSGDPLHEGVVTVRAEVVLDVVKFDFNEFPLAIGHLLQHAHVLLLFVDGVSLHGWVLVARNEFVASL
mmetsp:Transcript_40569/g.53217  ORF Transcript_40569/g.53217 Transcript_40569/m.53217 type:complete len:262 (-) Transcript_40569:180-965(-)